MMPSYSELAGVNRELRATIKQQAEEIKYNQALVKELLPYQERSINAEREIERLREAPEKSTCRCKPVSSMYGEALKCPHCEALKHK